MAVTCTASTIFCYRLLYRESLRAVQYAIPARYIVRSIINQEFRSRHAVDIDHGKIENTLVFLRNAANHRGTEHRILKNLLHTWWWQTQIPNGKKRYIEQ